MHFQPGLTNSGIPPFGIGMGTQGAVDYGMPFQFPSSNHSSSLQILDQSCNGSSEVETPLIWPPLEVSQMDDLTAVVTKCNNANAFLKPSSSPVLPAQPTPQFRSIKRQSEKVEGKQEVPLRERCDGPLMKDASHREIHFLSERRRRRGMNQLLSKMSSFCLIKPPPREKATIVEETINYIHYLHRRLDIRMEKRASKVLPKQGAETRGSSWLLQSDKTGPAIFCDNDSSADVISPKISFNNHGKDLFITMKCRKKGSLLSSIMLLVEGQNLNVMDAFVSTDDTLAFYCLHLQAPETLDAASREALEDTLYVLMNSELQP